MKALLGALLGNLGGLVSALSALAFALSLTFWYGHHKGALEQKTAMEAIYNERELQRQLTAAQAASAVAAKSQDLIKSSQENVDATKKQLALAQLDAASAADAAAGLRQRVQALVASANRVHLPIDPAAAPGSAPGPGALVLLAGLHERDTNLLLQLAPYARGIRERGLLCEQQYGAVEKGVNEHNTKKGLAPDDGKPMDMEGMAH